MALKFYSSMAKGSQLKVKTFLGVVITFGDVTGDKLVGGLHSILNRVNVFKKNIF